jgi:hypothetical protein
MVDETGQPYAFTGDDPLNAVDPDGNVFYGDGSDTTSELLEFLSNLLQSYVALLNFVHPTGLLGTGSRQWHNDDDFGEARQQPAAQVKRVPPISPNDEKPKVPEKASQSRNSANRADPKDGDSDGGSSTNNDPASGNYCISASVGSSMFKLVGCGETGGSMNGSGDCDDECDPEIWGGLGGLGSGLFSDYASGSESERMDST